jgi:hypothetical protein
MIQTLAPDRADEAFHDRVLPWAVGCRQHFTDAHAPQSVLKEVTVDAVAVAEEIGRRGVFRKGVHHGGDGGRAR